MVYCNGVDPIKMMSDSDNEIFVSKIDPKRYMPNCEMRGIVTVDDKGDHWEGTCRNTAVYEIDIRPPEGRSNRYARTKCCEEHLEIAKKQGMELKIE